MNEKEFELKIPNAPPLIPKILEEYIKRLEEENKQLKENINKLSILLEQSMHKQIFYKKQFETIRKELE